MRNPVRAGEGFLRRSLLGSLLAAADLNRDRGREGIRLFERVRSDDHTGIIGLPLLSTAALLREAGLLAP